MSKYSSPATDKQRIPLVIAIFVLLTFCVYARLFYLQVYKHGSYQVIASAQHSFKDTIYAKRGQIFAYDTISGTPFLLASNQSLNLLYINPKEIENKEETITKLVEITGMKREDVMAKFDDSAVYVIVMHKLTKAQSDKVTTAN